MTLDRIFEELNADPAPPISAEIPPYQLGFDDAVTRRPVRHKQAADYYQGYRAGISRRSENDRRRDLHHGYFGV